MMNDRKDKIRFEDDIIIPAHYYQNGNQLIFDTTGLANGTYFIQFMQEGKVAERVRAVVEH